MIFRACLCILLFLPAISTATTLHLVSGTLDFDTLPQIGELSDSGNLALVTLRDPSVLLNPNLEGLTLLGHVESGIYFVHLLPQAQKLIETGLITSVRSVPPELKISPRVQEFQTTAVRLLDENHIPSLGSGTLLRQSGSTLSVSADRQTLLQIARSSNVLWVEPVPTWTLRNDLTSWVIQSDLPYVYSLYTRGLSGEGEIVGHIDGPPSRTSCYFEDPFNPIGPDHRKYVAYHSTYETYVDGHGTHTAGTVAGFAEGEANNGIAYNARLTTTNIYDVFPFGETQLYDVFTRAYNEGARIHTNSWGDDATTAYTQWCADIDTFTHDYEDNLVLFSVSNGLFLKTPENAKNTLAMGASYQYPQEDSICSGGMGPTSDGRLKPELFTPGCGIRSAASNSPCGTITLSGTSMASPAVAAAAALTREYFLKGYYPYGIAGGQSITPTGSLIKAILLSATRDMPDPDGYPTMQEGWGHLVLDDALYFSGERRRLFVSDIRHSDGLVEFQVHTYSITVKSNTEPLRIALTWADYPAVPFATQIVVNNLDLKVTAPNGIYLGNNFLNGKSRRNGAPDPLNNVEQVIIDNPEAGTYTIEVRGTSIPVPSQGYALVVTGDIVVDTSEIYAGVAHKGGASGTSWKSDMVLANFSSSVQEITVAYQEAGYDTSRTSQTFQVDGQSALHVPDVIGSFLDRDSFGFLEVEVPVETAAVVRTFNQTETGQLGQNILAPSVILRSGGTIYLPGLFQDSSRRTNLGWINKDHDQVSAALTLLGPDGLELASMTEVFQPDSMVQEPLTRYFPNIETSGATLRIDALNGSELLVYASVVTMVTGDAVYIPGMIPQTAGFFPVIASSPGSRNSLWRTEIILFNPLDSEQEIHFHARLFVDGIWKSYQTQVNLHMHETARYSDILNELFNLEEALGYLEISGTLTGGGRIYSSESIDSSVGQYVPFTVGPEVTNWRLVSFPADQRRTNIGILNRGESTTYCALKPLGEENEVIVGIPAMSLKQISVDDLYEDDAFTWAINCDGAVYTYASSVDNLSQDAVFLTGMVKEGLGLRW